MPDSKNCAICERPFESHARSCPQGMVEMYRKQRLIDIRCPACSAEQIDTNAAGLHECRYCHAQYTTDPKSPHPKTVLKRIAMVWDKELGEKVEKTVETIPVSSLPEKGAGEFPIDKRLEAWALKAKQARLEAVRKRAQA